MRLHHCLVTGIWAWRPRIDYLRLGRRTLAEVEAKGRRIAQLQVALAEEEWILAAVVEEELLLQAEVVVANNSEKIRIGFN